MTTPNKGLVTALAEKWRASPAATHVCAPIESASEEAKERIRYFHGQMKKMTLEHADELEALAPLIEREVANARLDTLQEVLELAPRGSLFQGYRDDVLALIESAQKEVTREQTT